MSTPKSASRRPPQSAQLSVAPSAASSLDVFPVWQDQPGEKEPPGKFEDPLGTALPPAAQQFCDAWKRAEELLHGAPNVPMVCLRPAADVEKKGKGGITSRELDGKLYAGHETFDWLLGVISYVMSAEKYMTRGEYLWELIHPKDKDGLPARSPSGKYRVKLFILDTWRTVTIDDRIPVDLFGRALLVGSRPLQLWPLLLCKAILKVMAVYRSLHMTLPHQVAAFQMLTGWPQEDLLDPLGGTPLAGGALFDRLQEVLGGQLKPVQELPAVASCCLVKRSKPQRAPPRLVVLAGPSAVGRSALIARLLQAFPDKFGVTVSHTSRPPREHEVDGRDYHFTDKHKLLCDVRAKKFLEATRVTVHARPCTSSAAAAAAAPRKPVSYWYGTSLGTVREVAATGKLCLMSLDMQGAEALRSNKRIDGLYLYLNTSSPSLLADRQKQRLAEAPSTLTKRLTWAKQQVAKSSTAGLFDAVIPNTNMAEVYTALKEAISTLSPIIRNRLRGLPAYVLDYSDLIPPNSVEKPFLKPVILAGPNVGERRKLLEMLAEEFPDVFAFPCQHTTQPPDEQLHHVGVDGDELQLVTDKPGGTPRPATATADNVPDNDNKDQGGKAPEQQDGPGNSGTGGASAHDSSSSSDHDSNSNSNNKNSTLVLGPAPVALSKEDFDAAVAGGKFLESHADLFKHPLVMHKHGHTMEHIREVIKSGKLPLMELEAEGAEAIKLSKNVDCLTIFLAPPSMDVYEQRLKDWVTESDDEIAERQKVAAAELAAVQSNSVFDQVVINNDLDEGYKQLKAAISKFRPDLIPPAEDEAAAQAAKKAASNQPVPLLVFGPTGGGREHLVQQLQQRYPQRLVVPHRLTDRKPGKGEKELSPDIEYVKPDLLAKLAAQGQLVHSQQEPGNGSTVALTADALHELAAAGKMAVVDIGAATSDQLQAAKQHPAMKGAFTVLVCRKAALAASLAAAGVVEAAAALQLEKAMVQLQEYASSDLVQAVVSDNDPEEAFAQLQEPLSMASPWAMPPLFLPVVVAAPFGSGKRAVLQKLVKSLPDVFAVPRAVTSKPRSPGNAEDMEVVSVEVAQQMQQSGAFLVSQQVLGHIYGIAAATVRKLQASGKLPVLDLDRVADVAKLRASGFQATYIYLQPPSLEQLQQRISADILANPPLHHEPLDAAQAAAAEAVREASAAAAKPELFDIVVVHDPQDVLNTVGRLSEVLQQRYPSAVPSSFVWGYGRPLWDPTCRVHGLKPLKVMLLGPAASGKSTQCSMLASRFGIPHINAGDLLYAEVAAKTPLGLEAKQYMDSSKTVPDRLLLTLMLRRLAAPDCQAQGWAVDGFPHTQKQAQILADAGHVPDKVVILEGPHALLLDRVRYRRIDYSTGKVYHLAEAGALSEAVRPLRPDGSPDLDIMSRLAVRHDDSLENVANRLALWDRQVQGLRAAYEDVLLRLPAAGSLDDICSRAEAFVKLEATTGFDGPGSVGPVIASTQLEELMYRVVATLRYQRQQLVQLRQLDGKVAWCDLKELSSNCSCMLLAHNPSGLPVVKSVKRLDSATIPRQHLLAVESQEPFRLLACLAMGPQHPALPPAPPIKKVFVLAGPAGAGRSTLAYQLLKDFPDKLMAAAVLTNRKPHKLEVNGSCSDQSWRLPEVEKQLTCNRASRSSVSDGSTNSSQPYTAAVAAAAAPVMSATSPAGSTTSCMQPLNFRGSELLQFVPEQQFKVLQRSSQLVGMHHHLGFSYGVPTAALEAIAAEGKAAMVVGPLLLAEQLRKDLQDTQVVCVHIDADVASLDCRLRQACTLEEECLQELLHNASQQRPLLQHLLDEQADEVREEQQQQQAAAAAAAAASALLPSVPATPQGGGTPGRSRLGAAAGLAGTLKPVQLQQQALLAAGQQQQQLHEHAVPRLTCWLHTVSNPAGQLQLCYSEVKGVLAKHWPLQQQRLPGLLLVQRHAAVSTLNGSSSSSSNDAAGKATSIAADAAAATASGAGLDDDVYSHSCTVLRLRSTTASSSMLQLPRGKHLLQLQCSPLLLHCMTFYAAADFALEEASKLLPAACGVHVMSQEGQHEALQPGSRQLLFRYLLKPNEPCQASFELRTSSAVLQSCSQLLVVANATRQVVNHVLNQPLQVQLQPAADKGYTMLALAEPAGEVPASSWSVTVTSSRPLPPLQDLAAERQAQFEGVYTENAKAVVARYVIAPTVPVQLAVLSQLKLPAPDSQSPIAASSNYTNNGSSSSSTPGLPLSYTLQLFDTAGAKEVSWGASYKLVAEAAGGSRGRAMLPSVQLQPGKYLVVLQLQPDTCQQWVDPVTGNTDPAPSWQLLLLPSADDKICPIVRDDAYERHFKTTIDNWQQQAASANSTAASSRPSSGTASISSARLAAARDRPKQAQAALDRYQLAEQQMRRESMSTSGPGLAPLSIPGGPAGAAGGLAGAAAASGAAGAAAAGAARRSLPGSKPKASGAGVGGAAAATASTGAAGGQVSGSAQLGGAITSGSAASSLQATPRLGTPMGGCDRPAAAVVVRQLKGAEVLTLFPNEQMKCIPAASAASALYAGQLGAMTASATAAAAGALSSRTVEQPSINMLQAQEAAEFADWRNSWLAQQAISGKQEVLKGLFSSSTALDATPLVAAVVPTAHKQGTEKAPGAKGR